MRLCTQRDAALRGSHRAAHEAVREACRPADRHCCGCGADHQEAGPAAGPVHGGCCALRAAWACCGCAASRVCGCLPSWEADRPPHLCTRAGCCAWATRRFWWVLAGPAVRLLGDMPFHLDRRPVQSWLGVHMSLPCARRAPASSPASPCLQVEIMHMRHKLDTDTRLIRYTRPASYCLCLNSLAGLRLLGSSSRWSGHNRGNPQQLAGSAGGAQSQPSGTLAAAF